MEHERKTESLRIFKILKSFYEGQLYTFECFGKLQFITSVLGMSRMFLGTELQETVEECPEYFSPNVVPPAHCFLFQVFNKHYLECIAQKIDDKNLLFHIFFYFHQKMLPEDATIHSLS